MAVLVNWNITPRIVTVPTVDGDEISIQSAHDQLKKEEESPQNQSFPRIILTSGKDDLGGGEFTGLTGKLQNAQLEFEANTTPIQTGTVTTADTIGRTLIDSAATFQTNGVKRGDWLVNFTDESVSSILTIDSETQLTCTKLEAGTENDFDAADAYKIWAITQKDVNGGNMLAVDVNGASISSIYTSFGNQIVRTSSSSATLSDRGLENLQFLVESARSDHSGYGDVYYWDPTGGSDNNSGRSKDSPAKTFAHVHDNLVQDRHNDVVVIIHNVAGIMTITERITISKSFVYLRGPGRLAVFDPAGDTADTIIVTGDNVELSSFCVKAANGPTLRNAVSSSGGTFLKCTDLHIDAPLGNGFDLTGGSHHLIRDCIISFCGGDGIEFNDCVQSVVENCLIQKNTGWGIEILSTVSEGSRYNLLKTNTLHHNTLGAVHQGTNTQMTIIRWDNYLAPPSLATIQNDGLMIHNAIVDVDNRQAQATARAVGIQKNAAFSNIEFLMVNSTDHVTPQTSASATGQRSIDGGGFVGVSGTIAEIGNGIYQFDALAADTNGDLITYKFSGTSADDTFVTIQTVA